MGSELDGVAHITDRNGNPNVFKLERNDDGLWLNNNWAKPDNKWNPNNKFAFCLRKYLLSAPLQVAVFLFKIAQTFLPAAEHSADCIKFCGYILAVPVGN